MLNGKKILLGITGSIAAYKSAILIRLLVKEGAEVRAIMTTAAKEFISPLTIDTLSKHPVLVDFFKPENGDWNSHIELGEWADIFLIAPATANTIAKMANGIADNLLLTTYLSSRCSVIIVPAMDLDMFKHITTSNNIAKLQSYNHQIIEPTEGELASGLSGKGRMEEPEKIVERLKVYTSSRFLEKKTKKKLINKKIIITAGPTFEAIDPVRYISNYSSGKMGYAIADELAKQGAEVFLISGPVNITTKNNSVNIIPVVSAEEMNIKCLELFSQSDGAILSAAVADFTPAFSSSQKIKQKNLTLELKATSDIAYGLGKIKEKNQFLVGFALETENETENAKNKLIKKNFDFIVLNSLNDKGAGFQHNTNKITIIDKDNNVKKYLLKTKELVAIDIINKLVDII